MLEEDGGNDELLEAEVMVEPSAEAFEAIVATPLWGSTFSDPASIAPVPFPFPFPFPFPALIASSLHLLVPWAMVCRCMSSSLSL